jgi:hypothetical protein
MSGDHTMWSPDSRAIFDFAWSLDGAELAVSRGSKSSDAVLVSDARP